jgi:hypothetical protein
MSDYTIGCEIERPTEIVDVFEKFRVVRIVGKSVSLFQDEKEAYLQTESYVELKAGDGTIAFAILTSERTPYVGPVSTIKGLEPINFGGSNI